MEKLMQLVKIGPLTEREFKRQDGSVKKIQSRMLTLTNGTDTIYGETGERLTGQIEASDQNLRLKLLEGHVYNCDFTIRASDYEKDGKKGTFVNITINKLYNFL